MSSLFVLLIACSGGTDAPESPSQECLDVMADAAAQTQDKSREDDPAVIYHEALTVCETADAWVEALKVYPAAGHYTSGAYVTDEALVRACVGFTLFRDTPVCQDAEDQGRLESPTG